MVAKKVENIKPVNSIEASEKGLGKDRLVELIRTAQKSISVLGATVVDLPWAKLVQDGLGEKFFAKNSDFTIRVLCESESLISQYALLSELNSGLVGSFTRGNLNGIKKDVLAGLKGGLISFAKSNNIPVRGIEPTVDVKKKALDKRFNECLRREILGVIVSLKQENKLRDEIQKRFVSYLDNQIKLFFAFVGGKYNVDVLFSKASEFQNRIADLKLTLLNVIKEIDITSEQFMNIDMSYIYSGCETNCFYFHQDGVMAYDCGDGNVFKFSKDIEDSLHEAIVYFSVDNGAMSFENRKLNNAREAAEKMASEEMEILQRTFDESLSTKQRLFIKNCYLPMPVAMIEIDGKLYITQALTEFDHIEKYQYVGEVATKDDDNENVYKSYWITEFRKYYNRYFIDTLGAQKYSTEETAKGNRKEVVDMFDGQRVRIGSGPRDAFLANPSIIKLVVWALIFDRKGRMLIHQRALNAKDNRGLWDKSVGGHVSIEDLDTIDAVKREIAEELYTDEKEGQGGHDDIKESYGNVEQVIYLGDWKTQRYPNISDLHLEPKESYLFSLNYARDITIKNFRKEIVKTTRILPGGERVEAMCFVDPYLCIVPEGFDPNKLHNSKYALLHPNDLRRCVNEQKIRLKEDEHKCIVYDDNAQETAFNVTSDLHFLVNSSVWTDVVTEFARKVEESFKNKKR